MFFVHCVVQVVATMTKRFRFCCTFYLENMVLKANNIVSMGWALIN